MFMMWFAVVMSVLGGVGDSPDYAQQRFNIVLELLCIPAALLAIAPSMLLRRIAMRALRKREINDHRNPILLLRSFADDRRRLRARSSHRRAFVDRLSLRRWERFEEIVAASLGVHGPVYAVGQLGERLPPPLGAVRRQFTNEEWRDHIQVLMANASTICVTLGRSKALEWEIQTIAQLGFLPKTIFVLPPTSRREHLKRLAVLAATLNLNWSDLNVTLAGSWALSIQVAAVGAQPQVIRARAQEDVGYDIALELARLGAAGLDLRTPSLAVEVTAAPRPEIYDTGKTPAFKPLLRRKWTWWAIPTVTSTIVSVVATFLTGEVENTSSDITLINEYEWWAVAADPATSDMYGILDGVALTRLDFDQQPGTIVCKIEPTDNLVAEDGWLFASNEITGTLQAIDPASKRVVWTLHDLTGLRGVVATEKAVYFLLPASKEIRAVDRQSGATTATTKLDGIPWASALSGQSLFVSLLDSSTVVELDQNSLTKSAQTATGIAATQIVAADGTVWAYSAARHAVMALSGPRRGATILTRSQNPHLASNGSVLAIEGVEQMSTLWPDGRMRRNRLSTRHADGIAVTPTGDVLAMTDQEMLLIRASKRS
jgi:hypothetical protein